MSKRGSFYLGSPTEEQEVARGVTGQGSYRSTWIGPPSSAHNYTFPTKAVTKDRINQSRLLGAAAMAHTTNFEAEEKAEEERLEAEERARTRQLAAERTEQRQRLLDKAARKHEEAIMRKTSQTPSEPWKRETSGEASKTSVHKETRKTSRELGSVGSDRRTRKEAIGDGEKRAKVKRQEVSKEKKSDSGFAMEKNFVPPPSQFEDEADTGKILRESNDRLISYIDKARVMAGVEQMRGALPSTLTQTSTINMECRKAIKLEISQLEARLADARERKVARKNELERLMLENQELEQRSSKMTEAYWKKERELENDGGMEAELTGKLQSGKMRCSQLTEQVQNIEADIKKKKGKKFSKSKDEIDAPVVFTKALEKIDLGGLKASYEAEERRRQQELEEVSLKMKAQYEKQMRLKLEKERGRYLERIKKEMASFEKNTEELLTMYKEIGIVMQTKASNEATEMNKGKLESLQAKKKTLSVDIRKLKSEIRVREGEIAAAGGDGAEGTHVYSMKLEELQASLATTFKQLTEHVRSSGSLQSEMSVFDGLLAAELERSRQPGRTVRAKVSTSTRQRNFSADSILDDKRSRVTRRESGYFSPEPRKDKSGFLESLQIDVTDSRDRGRKSRSQTRGKHVTVIQI